MEYFCKFAWVFPRARYSPLSAGEKGMWIPTVLQGDKESWGLGSFAGNLIRKSWFTSHQEKEKKRI